MPPITVSDTWNSLFTTTSREVMTEIADNIYNEFVTLKILERRGSFRKDLAGGFEIALPVKYAKNTTIKAMSGYDTVDTSPQDDLTMSRWNWKMYSGSIVISDEEMLKNSSDHQRINLLREKTESAVESIRDALQTDIYTDATSDPSKKVTPIPLIIDNAPTTTVGGISGNTNSWWQNNQNDVGAFGTNLYTDMITAMNSVSHGSTSHPDIGVFSQTGHEYFERFVTGISGTSGFRIPLNQSETEDFGFSVFNFKGASIVWDPALASGMPVTGETLYLITSKYFFYFVHPQANFRVMPFERAEQQLARIGLLRHMCNLATNNRRKHSVQHGIDAS